jgi:hypothetical protein
MGYSEQEVATFYGETVKWVRARMMSLRREIEEQ